MNFKVKMIINYFTSNMKVKPFCEKHQVPRTTFIYWLEKYKNNTLGVTLKSSGRKSIITAKLKEFVKYTLDNDNYTTISEVYEKCIEMGFKLSKSTIYNVIRKHLNYTFKKAKVFIRPDCYNVTEVNKSIVNTQEILK